MGTVSRQRNDGVNRRLALLLLGIYSVVAIGCSGSGEGLDANGRPLTVAPDTSEPAGTAAVLPTLADIQQKVFTPTCAVSGCHSGASAPLGLQLDDSVAFSNLVNQASVQQADLPRVAPGDADGSYLIRKLEGTAAFGAQMPRNQPPLPVQTIQAIRDWINAGAPGPTLSSLQRNLFDPACLQCHFQPNAAGGLVLEQGQSYQNLVGHASMASSKNRVSGGSVEDSFLMDKLSGHSLGNSSGVRMPYGGPFLEHGMLILVEQWIALGAQDN